MKYAYFLDPCKKPEIKTKIGEVIVVKCQNAFGGDVKREVELEKMLRTGKHHPLTGPIYVEKITSEMNVEIAILGIKPDKIGYQCCSCSSGMLKIKPFKRSFRMIPFEGDKLFYNNRTVVAKPSIGVIGTATRLKTRSGRLDRSGGNIDLNCLCNGSKIHLPCEVEGALVYLGDIHILQGNGEISGIAAEVSGEIQIRINVSKYIYKFPIIETEDDICILGYGNNIRSSIQQATKNAIKFVSKELNMSFLDTYSFLSLIGNVILGHSTGAIVSSGIEIKKEYLE